MIGRYHRWTSSTNAGSKCYHIKHSKIRSGEICERPYCQAWWNKILIEINTADATEEDIKNLYDLLSKLFDETKENYSPMVHYMVGEILEPVMMKMARLMKLNKPGWRRMSKKKYIVRCPHCNHRVFDADYADVEIRYRYAKRFLK